MNFTVKAIFSPFRPLPTSHCDMVDNQGPCCNTYLPTPEGMRVCKPRAVEKSVPELSQEVRRVYQEAIKGINPQVSGINSGSIDVRFSVPKSVGICHIDWLGDETTAKAVQELAIVHPSKISLVDSTRTLSTASPQLAPPNLEKLSLLKTVAVKVDGTWLHQNKIFWGYAIKWKRKRWGWHVSPYMLDHGFVSGWQAEELHKDPSFIMNDAIEHFSKVIGVAKKNIATIIFPENGRGEGNITAVGHRWRVIWDYYKFIVVHK